MRRIPIPLKGQMYAARETESAASELVAGRVGATLSGAYTSQGGAQGKGLRAPEGWMSGVVGMQEHGTTSRKGGHVKLWSVPGSACCWQMCVHDEVAMIWRRWGYRLLGCGGHWRVAELRLSVIGSMRTAVLGCQVSGVHAGRGLYLEPGQDGHALTGGCVQGDVELVG